MGFTSLTTSRVEIPLRPKRPGGPPQVSVITDTSFSRSVPYDLKGPNQKLVNGFRMPTNLIKQSNRNGPGVRSVISISGNFTYQHITEQTYVRLEDTVIFDLNLDREVDFRNATPNSIESANMLNAVKAKALIDLKSRQVSVGLAFAELHKTMDTGLGLVSEVVRGMVKLKKKSKDIYSKLMHGRYTPRTEARLKRAEFRGNRKPRLSLDRRTASEYLRYKYGIMPTIYDIEGVVNVSGNSLADATALVRARSQDSITKNVSIPYNSGIGNWNSGRVTGTLQVAVKTTYSVSVFARVDSSGFRELAKVGFDAGTIAEIAWDLTPFSFILDHVLPVADMIQAWSSMSGATFHTGTQSVHSKAEIKNHSILAQAAWNHPNHKCSVKLLDDAFTLTRSVLGSTPFPMPYVVNPLTLNNVATWVTLLAALRK